MTDKTPAGQDLEVPGRKSHWIEGGVLATVCALVIGVYAYTSCSSYLTSLSLNAGDAYYNLLVQGFRAGQLNLKKEAPPGLTQLADPYNPAANAQYGLNDLSYYKGKLYLYFGVTPAVVLFWPYVALTGHYLPQKDAVIIFCAIGFLASASLLCGLWRRYFAGLNVTVVTAGALGLGLATGIPLLLARSDVYEVCILAAVALLFGTAALTICLYLSANNRYEVEFLPALVLLAVVGLLGLERTLVTPGAWLAERPVWRQAVRGGWILLLCVSVAFNIFASVGRCAEAHDSLGAALAQLGRVEEAIGQFEQALRLNPDFAQAHNNLGVALRHRGREQEAIGQFEEALRLQPDYANADNNLGLALMDSGRVDEAIRHYQHVLLLHPDHVSGRYNLGICQLHMGRIPEAIQQFTRVLQLQPGNADAECNLGVALSQTGNARAAINHYEQALRIDPGYVGAHYNLGVAWSQLGRASEAIEQWEAAIRLKPDYAEAHNNLGVVLARSGRLDDAIRHYEQALRINPNYAEAHNNLGAVLEQAGRVPDAVVQYELALRIQPDFDAARQNLARLRAAGQK